MLVLFSSCKKEVEVLDMPEIVFIETIDLSDVEEDETKVYRLRFCDKEGHFYKSDDYEVCTISYDDLVKEYLAGNLDAKITLYKTCYKKEVLDNYKKVFELSKDDDFSLDFPKQMPSVQAMKKELIAYYLNADDISELKIMEYKRDTIATPNDERADEISQWFKSKGSINENLKEELEKETISELDLSEIDLVVNGARETGVQCFMAPEGYFEYELTEEEIGAVLSGYDISSIDSARVEYTSKDDVAKILSVEFKIDQNPNTAILYISPKELVVSEIYESSKKLSDILGTTVFVKGLPEFRGVKEYIADFEKDGLFYKLKMNDKTGDETSFARLLCQIVAMDGADLTCLENPEIPILKNDDLSLDEVYEEENFGKYMIRVPDRYVFNGAMAVINQRENYQSTSWSSDYDDINEYVYYLDDEARSCLIEDVSEVERYELDLYTIPWCDSVPDEFMDTVHNPLFNIGDLSLNIINKRTDDKGCMNFSVLYPDEVVVEIRATGLEKEYLFEELKRIAETVK